MVVLVLLVLVLLVLALPVLVLVVAQPAIRLRWSVAAAVAMMTDANAIGKFSLSVAVPPRKILGASIKQQQCCSQVV